MPTGTFSKQSATDRAQRWANATGQPHIVYRDGSYFVATALETYKADPLGYQRVTVVLIIQPQAEDDREDEE